jgi:hypothetical protein
MAKNPPRHPVTTENLRAALFCVLHYMEQSGGYNSKVQMLSMDAIKKAYRVLGMLVSGGCARLPKLARKRMREFGLDPDNGQIIDQLRWAYADSIYEQSGRLPWATFNKRYKAGIDPLTPLAPGDLPPLGKYAQNGAHENGAKHGLTKADVKKYVVRTYDEED